jgi:hypothetical protein
LLSTSQKQQLAIALERYKGIHANLSVVNGDGEAAAFATDVEAVLARGAGWSLYRTPQPQQNIPFSGVLIEYSDPNVDHVFKSASDKLAQLLRRFGIEANARFANGGFRFLWIRMGAIPNAADPNAFITITICAKPIH